MRAPLSLHIKELSGRLRVIVGLGVIFFGLLWLVKEPIMAMLLTHMNVQQLSVMSPAEGFYSYAKVLFWLTLLLLMPFLLLQIFLFAKPGLRKNELAVLKAVLLLSPICLVLAVWVSMYIFMPRALDFLSQFSSLDAEHVKLVSMPRLEEYLDFALGTVLFFAVSMQLPSVMVVLSVMGIVSVDQWYGYRKYVLVASFVLGAIITPPDVLSQIMAASILMVLYQVGLVCSKRLCAKKD